MIVELLGYLPDHDPTVVGVLTDCSGVVPTFRGMAGAPAPEAASIATLAATCVGSALLTLLDGTTRIFAGTATNLYETGSSTWTDVSRAATYTTGTSGRWRFAQQENVSFAANGADTLQASVSSGAFSCVAGAPIANIVEAVGKFVFGVNTATATNQIAWSALGDYTDWVTSVATQAGSDTVTETPGGITAFRRFGITAILYKRNSMYLGTNVGPPNIWQFDLIPGVAGALSQEVVVNIGTPENPKHIFMGEDNFYVYDGSKPIPIADDSVRNSVFDFIQKSRDYACTAMHDANNSRVYFWYPTTDSDIPDKCVVYHYKKNRWGRDDRSVEAVTEFSSSFVTYDALGALYPTYADFPSATYDAAFAGSSQIFPAIFDTSHILQTMTGASATSSITTGDYGDDQIFTTLNSIRPRFLVSPTSATMTNYYKQNEGDSLTTGTVTTLSSRNTFDVIREARWHRLKMSFVGDWEMAGFSPVWEKGGLE